MHAISTYRPRTFYLPPSGQTYLHLPGIRPNRGPCPDCGSPEDRFCEPTCLLQDPFAFNMVAAMMRCWLCDRRVADDRDGVMSEVLVMPNRPVRHYSTGERSACGLVRKPRAHAYIVQW